ncbi:c-type cytochrome [Oceanobacillus sp. 1P07AA]|uniref:c-type cytochrome n=1 Tax=Oceanobacillus sp. 1P07AA TaxID=3132293 RepID=UPI0039A6DCCA
MKKWLVVMLLGVVLTLGACGNADNDTATENLDPGEEVYRNNCASCHANDLSGSGGPSLVGVGSKYTQDEIAEIVTKGKGSMPPMNVEGQNLEELTNWLSEQ